MCKALRKWATQHTFQRLFFKMVVRSGQYIYIYTDRESQREREREREKSYKKYLTTFNSIRRGIWYRFWHGNISETTCSNNCYSHKLPIVQTFPGTTCFGLVQTNGFVRSPNLRKPRLPIETTHTRNTIWSRVNQIVGRDDLAGPFR